MLDCNTAAYPLLIVSVRPADPDHSLKFACTFPKENRGKLTIEPIKTRGIWSADKNRLLRICHRGVYYMEKTYCAYHPTKPALWYCESCDAYFCSSCITRRDLSGHNKKSTMYLCPKCKSMAQQLAIENVVEPFWNRLPKFFAYPFNTQVIIFIVVLSVFMTLFSAPGLFSKLFQTLLFGVLLKYGFTVIKDTAQGNMKPPEINERTISEDFGVVVKYWALGFLFFLAILGSFVFIMPVIIGLGAAAGMLLFGIIVVFLLLVYPAVVIVLATSGSLLSAINPSISVRMAWRIGPSYLLMYLFLIILYFAPATVVYFAQPFLPRLLLMFVFALVNCYYTIVAHHLMGYLILQHHESIGYNVDFETQDVCEEPARAEQGSTRDLINRTNVFIKEGKLDEAITLIQTEKQGEIRNLDLAERYYNLLKIKERTPEMLEHAKGYLDLLVRADKKDTMREVYLECAALDPSFSPHATALFRIAGSMNESGNFRGALGVYNSFIKASPQDPLVPKAYFLAANVFNEKLLNPEKASKVLARLIRHFPDSDIIPYAQKYLRDITQQG
jgi:tetratricopeptide (TPR) repeat protein